MNEHTISIDVKKDSVETLPSLTDKEIYKCTELHISYADAGNSLKPRNLKDPLTSNSPS